MSEPDPPPFPFVPLEPSATADRLEAMALAQLREKDAAAERSAHVTRGDASDPSGPSSIVETPGPGGPIARLRVVVELEEELSAVRRAWLRVIQMENGCLHTGASCRPHGARCGCEAERALLEEEAAGSRLERA